MRTAIVILFCYLMVAMICLLAGLFALEYEEDNANSVIYPLAIFWPFSVIGLCFYLLIRSSGVLEGDHQNQEMRRARHASKTKRA